MNKIYRVIWNASLGVWVAVSELAKSKIKTKSLKTVVVGFTLTSLSSMAIAAAGTDGGTASGQGATAISANTAQCSGPQSGLGEASASGALSIAIGCSSIAESGRGIAIGSESFAGGDNESIAIGRQAKARGDQSIAIGGQSEAKGGSSIAIGADDLDRVASTNPPAYNQTGNNDTYNNSQVAKEFKSLTGSYLVNFEQNDGAATPGPGNRYTKTTAGEAAVSLGTKSYSADLATAVGTASTASGMASVALGVRSTAEGKGALAIGPISSASKEGSTAIGINSTASGINSIAMGRGATASQDGSVALGSGSLANNATLNTVAYSPTGSISDITGKTDLTTLKQISVGTITEERRITNVAPGGNDTDAVNVSQLKRLKAITDKTGSDIASNLGGGSTFNPATGAVTNPTYTIGGNNYTNVGTALKASKTEVVEGKNITVTDEIGADGQTIYTVATADEVEFDKVTVGSVVVDATNNDITGLANTTLGAADFATAGRAATEEQLSSVSDSVADIIGGGVTNVGGAVTGPFTANGTDYNNIAEAIEGEAAAAKTEVEEGKNISVTSTTGTDGQTIYTVATADEVEFDKVTVGNTTITTDGLTIVGGPSITTAGINAGGKKVTNVADGEIAEDSTDAVNGSQLYALGDNITTLFGGNASYADNSIIWTNIGGTGKNTVDDAIEYVNNQAANANQGWKVTTDSGTTSTVKPGDTVTITGDTASGVTVSNTDNDIKIGLADKVTIGSGSNAVSIDGNAGTIQVGDVHIDGSTGNITAGQVIVNGEAGTVNGLTNTTWNPADIVSGQAATEDQLKQVADNAAQAAAVAKSTVSEGENITVSPTKNADGSTNYQVATKKDVTFDKVTSGSVIADKVAVGNVVIDQAGINAGGNKVTNVADGAISSTSKDAINGSQLHASNTNIYQYLGGGANYETNTGPTYNVGGGSHNNVGDALTALDDRDNQLDNKITNLGDQLQQAFYTTNERIDDVEKRANAGIAAAMALETAPYVAGKWTYAAAASYHGGENAVGVTFRKTADNGRWSLTSGIAAASQGDPSFRIGISGVID